MAFTVSKEVQARVWAARDRDTAFFCVESRQEKVVLCCVKTKAKTARWQFTEFCKSCSRMSRMASASADRRCRCRRGGWRPVILWKLLAQLSLSSLLRVGCGRGFEFASLGKEAVSMARA